MMKFLWFCASGYSFFWGTGIIICAILLSIIFKKSVYKLIAVIAVIIGIFLIFLSATPFSIWLYFVWGFFVFYWMILNIKEKCPKLYHLAVSISSIAICCLAIAIELPYFVRPDLVSNNRKFSTVYVIGDSISAGVGGQQETTWPVIIKDNYKINIINLAQSGATASNAYRQAENVSVGNSIVMIEIGGNDILGNTPVKQFENELERLLQKIIAPSRLVIMFELPALPWQSQYIAIQRKLSKKYHTILIPRRFFVSVLQDKDSTTDGIHLTEKGQEKMAQTVWPFITDNIEQN